VKPVEKKSTNISEPRRGSTKNIAREKKRKEYQTDEQGVSNKEVIDISSIVAIRPSPDRWYGASCVNVAEECTGSSPA
jgi:hypothetical protein